MALLDVKTLPIDKEKVLIEASAGTGKTYTIGLLVIRLLLEKLIPIEKIVLITFTEDATAELKKETCEKIRDAYNIWKNGSVNISVMSEIIENEKKENAQIKEANLLDAIARIDELPVFTIHGFCRKLLGEFAFETGNFEEKEVVTDTYDILYRVTADFWRENIKDKDYLIKITPQNLQEAASLVLKHPKAEIIGEDFNNTVLEEKALQYSIVHKLAKEIRQRFKEEKNKLKIIDFNDMIEDCYNAVKKDADNNSILLNAVNKRYDAIMVDEFQDTDQVQYEIFDYLFQNKPFFMIGDPKQAIYRFRGGDIVAYKKAKESADENQFSMDTNYRSEKSLLDAMNVFFTNNSFKEKMGSGIDYYKVNCGKTHLKPIIKEKDNQYKPFVIWKGKEKENKEAFNPKVQTAVIAEIKRLLNTEKIKPQDITILLNTNEDCLNYKNALAKEGIFAIYSGGTIFTSEAAVFLRILLNAVLYNNTNFTRALLTHEFLGYEPKDIDNAVLLEWTNLLLLTKSEWEKTGVMHAVDYFLTNRELWSSVAANKDGERNIRNIRQILEILNKEENNLGNIPEKIVNYYNICCSEQMQSEESREKLETDENALKIKTFHSSKGLQFDIVFIPDVSRRPHKHTFPHAFMYYKDNKKIISFKDKPDKEEKELNDEAENEESARLLYVAITRAKYRVYTAYNPCYSRSNTYLRQIFDDFCSSENDLENIQIEDLENVLKAQKNYKIQKENKEIKKQAKTFNKKIDLAWNRTSFTGISLNLEHDDFITVKTRPENEPPAGKRMGTLLHSIFEKLDFDSTEKEIKDMIEAKLGGYKEFSMETGEERKKWIQNKVSIILNKKMHNNIKLCDIDSNNKIAELNFFMISNNMNLKKIKDIFKNQINDFKNNDLIAKYLKGAIDLVFMAQDGKYYILDWKSNSLNDYSREGMENESMIPHGYHLQYGIYAVALKRWLEATHDNFNFKEKFGGVFYIFIRGVTEKNEDKDNENGIYFADSKEINKMIEELDLCFGRSK